MAFSRPTFRLPRKITNDSEVLLSNIPLPSHSSIVFTKFIPYPEETQPFKVVDVARQKLIKEARESGSSLTDSLLPTVSVGKGGVSLWVFAIQPSVRNSPENISGKGKQKASCSQAAQLQNLALEGLQHSHCSYFTPSSLYPCSPECAKLLASCPLCGTSQLTSPESTFQGEIPTTSTAATLFPRKSLRNVYSHFLNAVRERLLDDICSPVSTKCVARACRLGLGFLSSIKQGDTLWGFGWERGSQSTPLIHTALDVSLSSNYIHIRPLPTVTTLRPIPLQYTPPSMSSTGRRGSTDAPGSPPLTAGIPLILAPYPTPAFYISSHPATSIPSSLRAQFTDALTGLGVPFPYPPTGSSRCSSSGSRQGNSKSSPEPPSLGPFILVYIPLINPQGESKGVGALWPSHLCFIDTSPSRMHLTTLPELTGIEGLLTPPRVSSSSRPGEPSELSFTLPVIRHRSSLRASSPLLSRALRSFRALEIAAQKRIPGTPVTGSARHAAGYVESVVKEREKERERANQERLRRERELKEAKISSSPAAAAGQTPNKAVRTVPVQPTEKPSPAAASSLVESPKPGTAWHPTSLEFFVKAAQEMVPNNFYPSPPDWNPVSSTTEPASLHTMSGPSTSAGTHNAQLPQTSATGSQPVRELDMSNSMDLDVDIEMTDISINIGGMMDNLDASGLLGSTFGSFADTFTDDDFNYFDAAPIPEPTPDTNPTLSMTGDHWLTAELGGSDLVPAGQPVLQPAIVLSASLGGTLGAINVPPAPDLIPSSPARSASTPGNPPTPSIDFHMPPPTSGRYIFDPIDFGDRHHLADVKYTEAGGKFAVPQTTFPNRPDYGKEEGWRFQYDAVTDPRIGVINRLKRKKGAEPFASKAVNGRLRDEEWESIYTNPEEDYTSDSSLSSDSDEPMDDPDVDDRSPDDVSFSSQCSRPATPTPSGHPLSPSFLYFHMDHTHLLPLGSPMRPSFDEMVSDDLPAIPLSVPTPVSPGAALGSASERNKSLEFLVQAVAREVVENGMWAEAWSVVVDSKRICSPPNLRYNVSQTDLMSVTNLMRVVPDLHIPLSLALFFEPDPAQCVQPVSKLEMLSPPKISIARGGLVHHMSPSSLRFWEKEGLGPRSGTKDVISFALFEGEEKVPLVRSWLDRVGRVYSARGFGTHAPGKADPFTDGLVPTQFETVRKTLPNLLAALPSKPAHIVIYIIAPPSMCSTLESPALRAIVKSQKYVAKIDGQHDFGQDRVLIHFVPDYCIEDPHTYPGTRHVGLEHFATSVYNRLLRVCVRETSRQFWEYSPAFENRFKVPAFTLARTDVPRTQFQWDERPSLNVLDRHTFLHVGYRLSNCKRWLFAACIDERGEAHDVAVWGYDSQPFKWIVYHVWIFVKQFSQQADTEWRIVVSKLGEIGEGEVEAWMSHLETMMSTNTGPPLHVSLVCAQNDIPLPFLSPVKNLSSAVSPSTTAIFTDVSSMTYAVFFPQRMPIISSSLLCPQEFSSFVQPPCFSTDDTEIPPPPSKILVGILPLGTTALLRTGTTGAVETLYIHLIYAYKSAKSTLRRTTQEVHGDITRNWHDLAVLTRERWCFPDEGLPFHLAALEAMSRALDPNILAPDLREVE